jgi:hypothetical protein
MVSELEGTGKKPSATALRCYLVVFPEKLRDTTKSVTFTGVPSKIRKKTFRMRARSVSSCFNLLDMNHNITLVAEKAFYNNINGRTFVRRSHITFLIRHTTFAVNLTQSNKVTWYESICYFQNAKLLFQTRVFFFCRVCWPVPMGTCWNLHQQPEKMELFGISYLFQKLMK